MVMVNRLVGSKNTAPRSTILEDRFTDYRARRPIAVIVQEVDAPFRVLVNRRTATREDQWA
jgi:hypothetical protein